LITLLTDFGTNSIYSTLSNVWFQSRNPEIPVVDLSHEIHPCDINEAAYLLELMITSFPPNTVHVIAVDFDNRHAHRQIVHTRFKGQHILTYNSGLLTLLPIDAESISVAAEFSGHHSTSVTDGFGPIALQLSEDPKIDQRFTKSDQVQIKNPLKPVILDDSLQGHIRYFDARGTAYTDISRTEFDAFTASAKSYAVVLSRHEKLTHVSTDLEPNEGGRSYCYFNQADYLTIEMHRGAAQQMYGLKKGQRIIIEKT
jgi:S-adenosylmethionine hydrolase